MATGWQTASILHTGLNNSSPSWIVKLFPHPTPGAEEYFDVQHSAVRKDIERGTNRFLI